MKRRWIRGVLNAVGIAGLVHGELVLYASDDWWAMAAVLVAYSCAFAEGVLRSRKEESDG